LCHPFLDDSFGWIQHGLATSANPERFQRISHSETLQVIVAFAVVGQAFEEF